MDNTKPLGPRKVVGKVVDRVSKKENYENESGVLTIEHPLLEYVLPMISTMRVSVVGRKS